VSSRLSQFVPWHDRPAHPFAAKEWLEERYRFRIPTPLAALAACPAGWATSARREFPVKRWLKERQLSSHLPGMEMA
jgi:hypothetical protein